MAAASHGAQAHPGPLLEWLHKLVSIRRRGRPGGHLSIYTFPEYHVGFQKAEPRPVGSSGMLPPVLLSHALGPIPPLPEVSLPDGEEFYFRWLMASLW